MQKIDFDWLMVSLASPEEILKWSHGSIEFADTVNYRTGKPRLKWLFCEAIFGPTKNYECSCGKYKGARYKWFVCERCGVEIAPARVRRERMGHIELASPVVHVWYYKTTPSRIGLLLNLSLAEIEKILYFVKYIATNEFDEKKKAPVFQALDDSYNNRLQDLEQVYTDEIQRAKDEKGKKSDAKQMIEELESIYKENKKELENEYSRMKSIIASLKPGGTILESDYRNFFNKFNHIFALKSWWDAILELLAKINLEKKIQESSERFNNSKWEERKKTFKLLRLLINLFISNTRPEWMVMKYLPVIPPDIRPVISLEGGKIATSDANQYYRRVVQRNLRLKKMIQVGMPDVVKKNEIRLLQESVNNLIIGDKSQTGSAGRWGTARVFKSLTDKLSKKEWIFRQNLLGKRVDYSGRSVITVWPNLALNECGIPLYIAIRIFSPFVISKLIERWYANTPKQAEKMIREEELIALDILQEVIKDKYVLLNRAPTLHKLSIQAFKVKLVSWKTVRIHPLVCSWFNADFDGDMMAVHLPLSEQAQEEAREIMSSKKNTLLPSSWSPSITLSQDMILWVYYLTSEPKDYNNTVWYFKSLENIVNEYEKLWLKINDLVEVKHNDMMVKTTVGRSIFNYVLPEEIQFKIIWSLDTNKQLKKNEIKVIMDLVYDIWWQELLADVANKLKDIGFTFAQQSSVTISIFDILTPKDKDILIAAGDEKVRVLLNHRYNWFYSNEEKSSINQDIWLDVDTSIQKNVKEIYSDHPTNNYFMLADSKARWSYATLSYLSGMRWLVQGASGKIIDLPIKSWYLEWYSPLEYFLWCHNSRKGRTDIALKTADSWYMTRKLCDSNQEVIVKEHDCNTSEYIQFDKYSLQNWWEVFSEVIYGRTLAEDVKDDNNVLFAQKWDLLDRRLVTLIAQSNIDTIKVRSSIGCKTINGVCQKCFGMDLSTRRLIELWVAIWIIASQSLGERTTQLTLDSKHNKWVAAWWEDVTQWGLARVDELLEVRIPKAKGVVSPFDGTVRLAQDGKLQTIEILAEEEKRHYFIKQNYKITVKKWEQLNKWSDYAFKWTSKLKVKEDGVVVEVAKDHIVLGVYKSEKKTVSPGTKIKVAHGTKVLKWQILTTGALDLKEYKLIVWDSDVQKYIVNELQKVYIWASQEVNRKYMEIVVKQMFSKFLVELWGDSSFVPGSIVSYEEYLTVCHTLSAEWRDLPQGQRLIFGLTQVAKEWASWLSAASFQETVRVMVENSLKWSIDELSDLKSNVILGRPLPIGSNFKKSLVLETLDADDLIEMDLAE